MAFKSFNFMNTPNVKPDTGKPLKKTSNVDGVVEQFVAGGDPIIKGFIRGSSVYDADPLSGGKIIGTIMDGKAYYLGSNNLIGNLVYTSSKRNSFFNRIISYFLRK